ncbi:MAG: hypothetical protein ACPGWR_02970 [Ardenticatenaceae bacterium]
MIKTIQIIQEPNGAEHYRAIQDYQQATGKTAGEALDSLEQKLALQGEAVEESLILVQRFKPDSYFTAAQQTRLQELMARVHAAGNTTVLLSPDEQAEQEQLIDAEWDAAIARAEALLTQVQPSTL